MIEEMKKPKTVSLPEALKLVGIVNSLSVGKRLIKQGVVSIDHEIITDMEARLVVGGEYWFSVPMKHVAKLKVEKKETDR